MWPGIRDVRAPRPQEDRMNPRKFAKVAAIAILIAGVLPAVGGCAALNSKLTNQPSRILTPDELPQIYRNY